jgi:hypothetical protein
MAYSSEYDAKSRDLEKCYNLQSIVKGSTVFPQSIITKFVVG